MWTDKIAQTSNMVLYDLGTHLLSCNFVWKDQGTPSDIAEALENHREQLRSYKRAPTKVEASPSEELERELGTQLTKANDLLATFKDSVDRETTQFATTTNQTLAEVKARLARMRGIEVNS